MHEVIQEELAAQAPTQLNGNPEFLRQDQCWLPWN